MVAAAYYASRRFPEQALLFVDAIVYSLAAVWSVWASAAPSLSDEGGSEAYDDGVAVRSLALFLAVTVAPVAWRHKRTARAACKLGVTRAYGNVSVPVCAIEEAEAAPAATLQYVPATIIVLVALWLFFVDPDARIGPLTMLLLASYFHFASTRVHGDHRGGKIVPTYFAIILHLAAAINGTSPLAALSLHRLLIVFTYLMTGFRKLYCSGIIWCDGKNLQLMMGVQGLYHDLESKGGLGLNFALAEYRELCRVGSIGVLGLQLLMPSFLLVPNTSVLSSAFWLAWSFHASNHVLWRINFFGSWCPALLALIVPGEQMTLASLWAEILSGRAVLPFIVLVVHITFQLGHALDELTEKLASRAKEAIVKVSWLPTLVKTICIGVLWMIELHCLGDYYTSYWPVSHEHRNCPVACFVVKYAQQDEGKDSDSVADEIFLPAPVCFYWRRDMSGGVLWPREANEKSVALIKGESVPLTTVVARLVKQLDCSFLPASTRSRVTEGGGRIFFCVRELRHEGTALRPVRLWDMPIDIALMDDISPPPTTTKKTT